MEREVSLEAGNSKAEQEKEHLQTEELRERGLRLGGVLEEVYCEVKVLHFTALGKPWNWEVEQVIEKRPDAYPLLAVQFGDWCQAAENVCPNMGI